MIDSWPPVLQDDISPLHFHVGETNVPATQKPAEDSATIGLEPRFTNFAAPAHCSRPVYQRLSIYEYTLQA